MKKNRENSTGKKRRKSPANIAALLPVAIVRPLRIRRTPKRGKLGWESKLKSWQFKKLVTLLKGGMTYPKAIPMIRDEWGIVTSNGAISTFWQRYCAPAQAPQLLYDAAKLIILDITVAARLPGCAAPACYAASFRLPTRPRPNAKWSNGKGKE